VAFYGTLSGQAAGDPKKKGALSAYQQKCAGRPRGSAADMEVYYATTRRPLARPDPRLEQFYSTVREDVRGGRVAAHYGRQSVSIPCHRQVGEVNRPQVILVSWREPQVGVDFVLRGQTHFTDRPAWLKAIGQDVAGSRRKELLVYVHGFNNGFNNAAYRAAQLHADLGIDGATVFYDWASRASPLAYKDDRKVATSLEEADTLADVLADLRRTGATRVYLAAHSMGNRVTMLALARLADRPEGKGVRFDELVLGSADIEKSEFEPLWRKAAPLTKHATLYASQHDTALALAKTFMNPEQRLGDASPAPLVFPALQTVDTSDVHGEGIAHDDFAGPALNDLRAVLWLSLAPDSRCILQSRKGPGGQPYWRISDVASASRRACDVNVFGDAVQLSRLTGSAKAAKAWASGPAAPRDPGAVTYVRRVIAVLSKWGQRTAGR
jgi:esterase/lipase superfamily enzyme